MNVQLDLAKKIDAINLRFTSRVKTYLADLSSFESRSLDWLMVEHYQFSARNTAFLATAVETAETFDTGAVAAELRRNLAEENGHARLYKRALLEIGIDVGARREFAPTSEFFGKIADLVTKDPSRMLGAMYATETAAVFEHEVFRDVSAEVFKRRAVEWEGARLKYFHDMHLSGVEQSHQDDLGVFLRNLPTGGAIAVAAADRPTINPEHAFAGAQEAIEAMVSWWQSLLSELQVIRLSSATLDQLRA